MLKEKLSSSCKEEQTASRVREGICTSDVEVLIRRKWGPGNESI